MKVWTLLAAALAAGCVAGIVWGGEAAVAVGMGTSVGCWWLLSRAGSRDNRRRREQAAGQMPVMAELLAAALRAGAPVAVAARAVGEALPGELGDRLTRVGQDLRSGRSPAESWSHVAPVPGAERLIRVAVLSAECGVALASALERLADDLREARRVRASTAAHRAGVLGVIPLGLCFLPAFLLIVVVPVVLDLIGDLDLIAVNPTGQGGR